jgi:hypothetical protein
MRNFRLFVIAFALNLVWEMMQMREYVGWSGISFGSTAACSAAAVGDSGYILLLYWLGSVVTADRTWISRMTPLRLAAIIVVGFLVAVIMERAALFASWWQYAASMPRIPVLSVGLCPVLQLMTVPLVVFWVATHWTKSGQERKALQDRGVDGWK